MRAWLSEQGIPYTERDVTAEPQAMAELAATGYSTTPVVSIGGVIVVGFDRGQLAQLLGREGTG